MSPAISTPLGESPFVVVSEGVRQRSGGLNMHRRTVAPAGGLLEWNHSISTLFFFQYSHLSNPSVDKVPFPTKTKFKNASSQKSKARDNPDQSFKINHSLESRPGSQSTQISFRLTYVYQLWKISSLPTVSNKPSKPMDIPNVVDP